MATIDSLKKLFIEYATRVGAPPNLIQFRVTPSDSGAAHIVCEGLSFCYAVTERGRELERRRTTDSDVLLYWLLSDITHEMASSYAAKLRGRDENFRKHLFDKQLELLGLIKPEWRARREAEIQAILKANP